MRKWLKRALLGMAVLGATVLVAGLSFEQWSRWRLSREMSPPGELVEVEGGMMHIHCLGEGTPTVVLEAGFGTDGSSSWDPVIQDLAAVSRVCAYDRPGILWSDPGKKPRDAYRNVESLHALLAGAAESPPYVLVGHSLGGPLVRVFADQYPDEVVGMVLVDSSHPEQEERFPPEVAELSESTLPSPFVMRFTAATGVLRWMTRPRGESVEEPDPVMLRLPQSVAGMMAEMDAMTDIMGQAGHTPGLGDMPLVVLTAGSTPEPLPPGVTEALEAQMSEIWDVLQRELATLSTKTDHRIIDDATHYIHHDRPDVVIKAISDVVRAVRSGGGRPNGAPSTALAYSIYGSAVELESGTLEGEGGEVSFLTSTPGDMDGDGSSDLAVVLVHDSPGSGVFYYLNVFLNDGNEAYRLAGEDFLGDRIRVDFSQIYKVGSVSSLTGVPILPSDYGQLVVGYYFHGPEQAFAEDPSAFLTRHWKVQGGKLVALENY